MPRSPPVEGWFAKTKPPSESALRRVRDIILGADPSMRERTQYGVTFSSTKTGDFGAFVRYREPGVNLRLHRGGRLRGRYPHLAGGVVKRIRIADVREANARAAELRAMVREWCAMGDDKSADTAKTRPTTASKTARTPGKTRRTATAKTTPRRPRRPSSARSAASSSSATGSPSESPKMYPALASA